MNKLIAGAGIAANADANSYFNSDPAGKYSPLSGYIKIFACNSNKRLAEDVAAALSLTLGNSFAGRFSDGEIYTKIDETVRGADCYIIQPTSPPVNENLMELLVMIDAMRRASAGNINAVIPYFGYARQDRKARPRDPISAKLVANLLVTAGANRILTMDLHCAQIQGFFDIPVDHLLGAPILADYYLDKFAGCLSKITVVSPDLGSVGRARAFAAKLDAPMAIVDKRRPKPNVAEVMNIIGDIKGRIIIIADDMVDTAGTLSGVAAALMESGALEVYACCTHPILSGPAIMNLQNSPIRELVVLDTVFLPMEKRIDKIKILSVAKIFAEAIHRIHCGEPVSTLFG